MFSFSLADAYRQQSASIFSPLCHQLYQRKLRDEHSSVVVNSFPLINAIPTFATTLCRLKVYANIDLSYLCFHISSSYREHLVISISIISKSRIRRAKIKKSELIESNEKKNLIQFAFHASKMIRLSFSSAYSLLFFCCRCYRATIARRLLLWFAA